MEEIMKKQTLPIILLLVLVVIMVIGLAACNPSSHSGGGNASVIDGPVTPVDPSDDVEENSSNIGSQEAWDMLKAAALNASAQGKDARWLNFDTSLELGFAKDTYNAQYVLRLAGSIDTQYDRTQTDTSKLLIELERATSNVLPDGTVEVIVDQTGPIFGLYFVEGQIVVDFSGLFKSWPKDEPIDGLAAPVHAIKTSDIDLTALLSKINNIVDRIGISDLLWDKIFGMNIGVLLKQLAGMDIVNVSLEDLIVNFLFGANKSRLIDYGEGHTALQIPCDLSLVASLLPLVQSFIPEDIFDLVERVLNIDLKKISALSGMALYLQADINDDKLSGLSADIDFNLNSFGKDAVIEKYGLFQNEIGIRLGYTTATFAGAPDLNVKNIVEEKYSKGLAEIEEFSILTFDARVDININAITKTVTIGNVVGSFGNLIENLLTKYLSADLYNSLLPLFEKEIQFNKGTFSLSFVLQGTINTRDNAKTSIVAELRSEDGTTALSIYYVGSMNALYIDASGIFTGVPYVNEQGDRSYMGAKLKVKDLNLNSIVDGLFDKVGDLIIDTITNLSIFQNTNEALQSALSDQIIVPHNGISSADDAQQVDTLTLINMIFDCIDINMDGDIFNITEIKVGITQAVVDAILGLVLKGDNAGIKVPITNIDLAFANQGVQKPKTLTFSLGLGVEEPLVSLDLAGQMQFGKILDKEAFTTKINRVVYTDNEFLPILEDGTLDITKFNISLSTGLTLDLETLEGDLGEVNIELGKLGIADDFLEGMVANILLTLGNIQGDLKVNLDASIDLSAGLTLDTLLNSQIRLTVTKPGNYVKRTDRQAPDTYVLNGGDYYNYNTTTKHFEKATDGEYWLEEEQLVYICLADGYVYIDLSVLFIGVEKVKIKLSDIMGLIGGDAETGGDALASADGILGLDLGNIDIMAIVAGALGKITVTDGFIEIGLAAGIIQNLLSMIGINGIDIKFASDDANGGIRLAVPDSLNLQDLQFEIWLAVGSNMDFTISLDGFQAGVDDGDLEYDIAPSDPDEYTNVLDAPYVSVDLALGFDFDGDEGKSDFIFGDDGEEVVVPFTFNDRMTFNYKMRVAADLDLTPVLDYLFGATSINTYDNVSELLIEISGSKFGLNEEVLLGLYYTGGTLYIDGEHFGITKVSTDIDLYALILNILMKDVNVKINDVAYSAADALVSADEEVQKAAKQAILFKVLTFIMSDSVKVEVTRGITEAIFRVFGIDTNNAIAYLNFAWDNLEEHNNRMFKFTGAIYNENAIYIGAATIYVGDDVKIGIVNELNGLNINRIIYDKDGNAIKDPDTGLNKVFTLSEYVLADAVHGGFDEIDLFNDSKDIVIPSIYAEVKGTISLGATAGNDEWSVGEWIANFLNAEDNPALYSFVGDLLLQYNIPTDVARDFGFRIALKARLNPDVPVNLTANVVFSELAVDDPAYTEVYKLVKAEYKLLSAEERETYDGVKYVKEYLPDGIPLEELKNVAGLEGDVKVYVKVGENFIKVDPTKVASGTKMYVAKSLLDIGYILSHSDLAIELYNTSIEKVDAMATQAEKNAATVLAIRLVAGDNGRSTIYLDFKEDFHIAIDNLDLASLLDSLMSLVGNNDKKKEAETSALLDGIDLPSILGTIKGALGGIIYSIDADQQGFKLSFAQGLVLMLVKLLAKKDIPADQFVQLNPETSFFEFFWKYALNLSLGIDPVKFAIGLNDLKVEIGGTRSVLPTDFNKSNYMTVDELDQISLNVALDIDFTLKHQEEEIRIEKYLDVLIADLGLKLGIEFPKTEDIQYGIGVSLGANLALNNPESTEIVIELLNTIEDEVIAGFYLKGSELYVDMGKLSEQAIFVRNTDLSDRLCGFIVELMGKLGEDAEALTAADDDASEQFEIALNIANGKLGLLVTENVIIGLIAALAGNSEVTNGKSITDIISEFGLDLALQADMSLDPVEINVDLDSNLVALAVKITDVGIATGSDNATADTISAKLKSAIERQDFVLLTEEEKSSIGASSTRYNFDGEKYVQNDNGDYQARNHFVEQADTHVITLNLALIVDYSACATYELVSEETLVNYSADERYSKNAHDGKFVKDPNGHYVRSGFSYDEVIEQLLKLPALSSVLATALPIVRFGGEDFVSAETDGSLTVGMLLDRLGLRSRRPSGLRKTIN